MFNAVQFDDSCIYLFQKDDNEGAQIEAKYFNNELKKWIDLGTDWNWIKIDFSSDIDYIFKKLKDFYFRNQHIDQEYQIQYDTNNFISDDSAFKISENYKKILVSRSTLTRPRIQQISTVLHILIHLYLNKISKGAIGLNKHDENFRCIMQYLNKEINSCISFNHKCDYSLEESSNWYICSGVCSQYQPFKGIVRSTIEPDETMLFWKLHSEKCNGTFYKIFEFRKSTSVDESDKIYAKHRCYLNPKPKDIETNSSKACTSFQIRENIDLTDETSSPVVRNFCDVVDLDDSQYEIEDTGAAYFTEFKKLQKFWVPKCPFCQSKILTVRLPSHYDVCMGYQDSVNHCIPSVTPSGFKRK